MPAGEPSRIGQFENAAVYFENADRDAPSPEALQSAIRARKDAGQAARALTLAAWGTSRYPNEKPFGDYVRGLFAELERTVYKVSIACSPTARSLSIAKSCRSARPRRRPCISSPVRTR